MLYPFFFIICRNQTIRRTFGSVTLKRNLRNDAHPMPSKSKTSPAVPPGVQRQIDENLRRIYAATLTEEIPDRLQELLKQLREKDASP